MVQDPAAVTALVHPDGRQGGSGSKDAGQQQPSRQQYVSQAIVSPVCHPDDGCSLSAERGASNNTRAGGIKACSTVDPGYDSCRAFIPKACGGNGVGRLRSDPLLIAGGRLDSGRLG